MIDRQYGRIIFVCDDCGEGFEAHSRDFDEAWQEAKEEGWTYEGNVHWCHKPCAP